MTDLSQQVVQAGGSTTHRLDELLRRPAATVLAQPTGRPPAPVSTELRLLSARPLHAGEAEVILAKIMGEDVRGTVSLTAKTTARHHAIARMLAAGARKTDVVNVMGVSRTTLSLLERSPAFQALLLEYMNMLVGESVETYTRLKVLGNLGVDELTERLALKPQAIKTAEVLEIVKMAADRTGLGPTSKQVTLNGRLTPADLRAAKAAPVVVEAEYSEEYPGGGADPGAGVREGPQVHDGAAAGGEEVRALAREVAGEANDGAGLVTDLGALFGR